MIEGNGWTWTLQDDFAADSSLFNNVDLLFFFSEDLLNFSRLQILSLNHLNLPENILS